MIPTSYAQLKSGEVALQLALGVEHHGQGGPARLRQARSPSAVEAILLGARTVTS